MKYQILVDRKAIQQLKGITSSELPKIREAIRSLGDNPRPYGYIKLKGEEAYRIRVGNYRIIYEILDNILIVKVVVVARRREVYK